MSVSRPATLVLLVTLLLASDGPLQAQTSAVRLRGVEIAREGSVVVVTVEATGPLPTPLAGRVDGPPRVFFDFPGIIPATRGVRSPGDPSVRGVRVALHSGDPLITRVVIDLVRPDPVRLEPDRLAEGRFQVLVGEVTAPVVIGEIPADLPPAPEPTPPPASPPPKTETLAPGSPPPVSEKATSGPAAPPKPASASPAPTSGASPPAPGASNGAGALPARDLERYRAQIADGFGRLLALRPLLTTIDQFASPPPDELQMGVEEFERVRRVMSEVDPPLSLRPTHDLLVRACALGTMATRLRAEANRTSDIGQVRNAGSAAAGARMLLDRACAEMGCDR
ncbi:MAG TPA: hypothetical protein VD833_20090 [Vicinamibacterales bacterium]|nr:hypothetical protein [Vicinamibacterales bacterium]